mmetsp:Transcript_46062/g.107708  ORF Transcript_46062/g.107708 Transcript_46062/m.107708 type:complete len:295 (+) Transcript_46062:1133-2017(+)
MPVLRGPPAVAHKTQRYLTIRGVIRQALCTPHDYRVAQQRSHCRRLLRLRDLAAAALGPKVELLTLQLRLPEAGVLRIGAAAELVPMTCYPPCRHRPLEHPGQLQAPVSVLASKPLQDAGDCGNLKPLTDLRNRRQGVRILQCGCPGDINILIERTVGEARLAVRGPPRPCIAVFGVDLLPRCNDDLRPFGLLPAAAGTENIRAPACSRQHLVHIKPAETSKGRRWLARGHRRALKAALDHLPSDLRLPVAAGLQQLHMDVVENCRYFSEHALREARHKPGGAVCQKEFALLRT